MSNLTIDHVGIGVERLEEGVELYRLLGLTLGEVEELPEEGVRLVFAGSEIELLQPTDAEGPLARFLARRGEGIHHVALRVEDLDRAVREFRARGLEPLGEPRKGARGARVIFLHPKTTAGSLIELVERGS